MPVSCSGLVSSDLPWHWPGWSLRSSFGFPFSCLFASPSSLAALSPIHLSFCSWYCERDYSGYLFFFGVFVGFPIGCPSFYCAICIGCLPFLCSVLPLGLVLDVFVQLGSIFRIFTSSGFFPARAGYVICRRLLPTFPGCLALALSFPLGHLVLRGFLVF